MKKILFIITICLFLTGCTTNYNLEISDNTFTEKINGNIPDSKLENNENKTDINMYDYLLNYEQPVFQNNDSIYFDKSLKKNNNSTDYEYSYTFNELNFKNSRILNECFDNYVFENKDDTYYISVLGNFKCYYTDKIKINVETDYEVIVHNAESKKKNIYTWTIEKDNTENLELYIMLDKTKKHNNFSIGWNTFTTIGLFILFILSGIAIFFAKKKLEN